MKNSGHYYIVVKCIALMYNECYYANEQYTFQPSRFTMNNYRHVLVPILSLQTFAVLQHVRISQLLTLLAYLSIAMWICVALSMLLRSLARSYSHASRRTHQKITGEISQQQSQPVRGGTAWTSDL